MLHDFAVMSLHTVMYVYVIFDLVLCSGID